MAAADGGRASRARVRVVRCVRAVPRACCLLRVEWRLCIAYDIALAAFARCRLLCVRCVTLCIVRLRLSGADARCLLLCVVWCVLCRAAVARLSLFRVDEWLCSYILRLCCCALRWCVVADT